MSHFAVLVVGDVDEQLAPFHEFSSTGIDDEYVLDIDITQELEKFDCIEDFLCDYGLEDLVVTSEFELDLEDDAKHKYGYAIVRDGKLIKAVERTNPNRKWDWYVVGGRWSNKLLHINGMYMDSLLKKDLDIEVLKAITEIRARREWDASREVIDGMEMWKSWRQVKKMYGVEEDGIRDYKLIDEAGEYYSNQESVIALKNSDIGKNFYYWNHNIPEDLAMFDRNTFVEKRKREAFLLFAIVKNKQWCEKGRMYAFGISDDVYIDGEWVKKFYEIFDSIGNNERITLVDCHI
jgi:hypothetical protein